MAHDVTLNSPGIECERGTFSPPTLAQPIFDLCRSEWRRYRTGADCWCLCWRSFGLNRYHTLVVPRRLVLARREVLVKEDPSWCPDSMIWCTRQYGLTKYSVGRSAARKIQSWVCGLNLPSVSSNGTTLPRHQSLVVVVFSRMVLSQDWRRMGCIPWPTRSSG